MFENLVDAVADHIVWITIVAMLVVHIVVRGLVDLTRTVGRERTRREIAAYIAEGSMTPEQGERLLAAKDPKPVD